MRLGLGVEAEVGVLPVRLVLGGEEEHPLDAGLLFGDDIDQIRRIVPGKLREQHHLRGASDPPNVPLPSRAPIPINRRKRRPKCGKGSQPKGCLR